MRRATGLASIFLLSMIAAVVPAGASDPMVDRPWPVDAAPAVSSSFCEYRDGHLHAGIDIRTYGREGVPCIAVGDGYVSRVRATPFGYGKVVYLQLDGGQTAVYAHLSEFAPAIDALVWAEQTRLGQYRVDFRPTPNRVRVRRGEVIAWSGSTGGVDPHLHFEVRNRREHPLDPFSHGFALLDTLDPVIARVALVPLGPEARVGGECFPLEYDAARAGPGRYVVPDTVPVSGPVGVRLLAWDLLNAASGRLAPRTIEVSLEGEIIAHMEFDAISFASSDEIGFVYDVGRRWTDRESWFQLYARAGETLRGRTFRDGGRLPTAAMDAARVHRLEVAVTDVAGNEARLIVPLRRSPAGAAGAGRRVGSELPGVYGYEGFLSVRGGTPVVLRAGDMPPGPRALATPGGEIQAAVAVAGSYRSLDFDGLGVEVRVDERTLYTDDVFYATRGPGTAAPSNAGLVARSGDVQIGPYSTTLRADMSLVFDVDAPDSSDAVYRRSERSGKWVFYPSEREGNTVSTAAKRPGVYAVFSDAAAPTIYHPRVASRLMRGTGRRIPEIRVRLEDTGSGIDDSRCAIFLDGIAQIARWDGRAKKFFVLLRDENIMGTRALTVVAYDNVGHRSQLDVHVDIPRRK